MARKHSRLVKFVITSSENHIFMVRTWGRGEVCHDPETLEFYNVVYSSSLLVNNPIHRKIKPIGLKPGEREEIWNKSDTSKLFERNRTNVIQDSQKITPSQTKATKFAHLKN